MSCHAILNPTGKIQFEEIYLTPYFRPLILLLFLDITDKGNNLIRKEALQVAHDLPSLFKGFIPSSKEDVLFMWIPCKEDEKLQLVAEG